MAERTVEDRLREEYFVLLPDARRVREELEAEVRYCLLPLSTELDKYEQIVISSRIKECESALEALRRRQEGATFDPDRADTYTLTALKDLVGVRVLAFPSTRLAQAHETLRERFPSWSLDPIPGTSENEPPVVFKYDGYCSRNPNVRGELQIVPMLIGLFWEVEHSAIYKASPQLKGAVLSLRMQERTRDVLRALKAFETEFEKLVQENPL